MTKMSYEYIGSNLEKNQKIKGMDKMI